MSSILLTFAISSSVVGGVLETVTIGPISPEVWHPFGIDCSGWFDSELFVHIHNGPRFDFGNAWQSERRASHWVEYATLTGGPILMRTSGGNTIRGGQITNEFRHRFGGPPNVISEDGRRINQDVVSSSILFGGEIFKRQNEGSLEVITSAGCEIEGRGPLEFATFLPGDANMDGRFTTSDFVEVFTAGRYNDTSHMTTWQQGDWNGDGNFDSADLVDALTNNTYEGDVAAVPESSNLSLILFALLLFRRVPS